MCSNYLRFRLLGISYAGCGMAQCHDSYILGHGARVGSWFNNARLCIISGRLDVPATVLRLEYDPNRSGYLALIKYNGPALPSVCRGVSDLEAA